MESSRIADWINQDIFTDEYQKTIADKPIKDYSLKPKHTLEQLEEFTKIFEEYFSDVPEKIVTPAEFELMRKAHKAFTEDPRVIALYKDVREVYGEEEEKLKASEKEKEETKSKETLENEGLCI